MTGEGGGLWEHGAEHLTQPGRKASQRRCHHTERRGANRSRSGEAGEEEDFPGKCQPRGKGASLEMKSISIMLERRIEREEWC